MYWSERWRTFHDFLSEFLCQKLGIPWCREKQAKPEGKRNCIIQWREDAFAEAKLSPMIDGVRTGVMTGVQRAYLNLAYNTYLIAHHAPHGQSDKLLETFLVRLRSERSSDFTGKLFETYAAAAFLKAGFTLEYENDSGGRPKHVEFIATYPATGRKFSVEVKARNHAASDGVKIDDVKRLRIGSKLSQALQKKVSHPRIIMIEINVSDVLTEKDLKGWPTHALEQIRLLEEKDPEGMTELPPAYVLVTNHAFHNNLSVESVSAQILATGFKIADYGPDVLWGSLLEFLAAQGRHAEMFALIESLSEHYDIPATFDGENPAYMFAGSDDRPRLKFGNWYQIPDEDGSFVAGRLYEAIVMEKEQSAFCCYQTEDGRNITALCPLTDVEMQAYRHHPETFFGEIRERSKPVKTWLEMALFFYQSFKHTPREKILEQTDTYDDAAYFRGLSSEELPMAYAERMGRIGSSRRPAS